MKNAGFVALNFSSFFEPEAGINTPEEFAAELTAWAHREGKSLEILETTMSPVINLDGETYMCKLADPKVASQKNSLWKTICKQGITHSVGSFLGYKWVYLYKMQARV